MILTMKPGCSAGFLEKLVRLGILRSKDALFESEPEELFELVRSVTMLSSSTVSSTGSPGAAKGSTLRICLKWVGIETVFFPSL
jgi:hypothetical protein